MKKLLILMLVLGLASTANAAIVLSLDGATDIDEISIDVSDTVVVDIYDTVGEDWLAYLAVYYETEGFFALSDLRWGAQAGDDTDLRGIVGPFSLSEFGFDATGIEVTNVWLMASTPVAGEVFLVDLHCEGLGNVIVELWDDSLTVRDTATIYQVPEPMTIALLGLGGLFLRRRR